MTVATCFLLIVNEFAFSGALNARLSVVSSTLVSSFIVAHQQAFKASRGNDPTVFHLPFVSERDGMASIAFFRNDQSIDAKCVRRHRLPIRALCATVQLANPSDIVPQKGRRDPSSDIVPEKGRRSRHK